MKTIWKKARKKNTLFNYAYKRSKLLFKFIQKIIRFYDGNIAHIVPNQKKLMRCPFFLCF